MLTNGYYHVIYLISGAEPTVGLYLAGTSFPWQLIGIDGFMEEKDIYVLSPVKIAEYKERS